MYEQSPRDAAAALPQEYEAYFRQHFASLTGYCRMLGAPDAEDVAQEAMIKLHAHWDKVKDPGPWTRRVARNKIFSDFKKTQGRVVGSLDDLDEGDLVDLAASFEARFAADDSIRTFLLTLPRRRRAVLALTVIDGYTPGEIAIELEMASSTVSSHLRHIRKSLDGLAAKGEEGIAWPSTPPRLKSATSAPSSPH